MESMDIDVLKDVDRISCLPDDVLCHILSLVSTKYAVATSILSKRWKHLSTLIPSIDVSDCDVGPYSCFSHEGLVDRDLCVNARDMFVQFVSKVLAVRALPNARTTPTFHLHCRIIYDQNILDSWILLVLLHDVCEFDINVNLLESHTLPCEIFKCNCVQVLKLGSGFHLHVPESAALPNLKVLELQFIEFIDQVSIKQLLSSCPVLEDLRLFCCGIRESDIFEIAHPLLKNLVLSHVRFDYYVIFDTPNLQNLGFCLDGDLDFLVKNMKSLSHAHIAWGSAEKQIKQKEANDPGLLLSSVQGTTFINEMHKEVSLSGWFFFKSWLCATLGMVVLPELLSKSPNLELLIFHEGFIHRRAPTKEIEYCQPDSLPVCFSRNLKEIRVVNFGGEECEMQLVERTSFGKNDNWSTSVCKVPVGIYNTGNAMEWS